MFTLGSSATSSPSESESLDSSFTFFPLLNAATFALRSAAVTLNSSNSTRSLGVKGGAPIPLQFSKN